MKIILTFPKTGSHLLAKILKAEPYPAMNLNATPKKVNKVIGKLQKFSKKNQNTWIHYPYNEQLRKFLNSTGVELHTLYRDPRDIICSIHRAIYRKTWHVFLDNLKPGVQLHKLPKQETLDILIDITLPFLEDYHKWGQTNLFKKHYYSQIIKNPIAKKYTKHKVIGKTGNYMDYMTEKQIKKSNKIYGDLINLWSPR